MSLKYEPASEQVPGTGAMSDLFTVGEVAPMRAGGDATVILVNTGLDKVSQGVKKIVRVKKLGLQNKGVAKP